MQPDRRASLLCGLVAVLFVVVQVTALTHEFAHASGEHEAPCGLHDAAEHLAMAPAPDVALGVPIPLVTAAAARGFDPLPPVSVRGSAARAPPPLR